MSLISLPFDLFANDPINYLLPENRHVKTNPTSNSHLLITSTVLCIAIFTKHMPVFSVPIVTTQFQLKCFVKDSNDRCTNELYLCDFVIIRCWYS